MAAISSPTRIKVLLADDHPVVREGLCAMLGTAPDIEVVAEAGDGVEAVDMAGQCHPDIILMDIRMPKMSGLEAAREIKDRFPTVYVIMLTIHDDEAYLVDAVRSGAVGYLLKDASKDLVIHTIRAVNSGGMLIKTNLLREAMAGHDGSDRGHRSASAPKALDDLTPREVDVLQLLTQGQSNKKIGRLLTISEDTVKKHVQSIMLKLGAADRTQAAVKAIRAGLREGPPRQDS